MQTMTEAAARAALANPATSAQQVADIARDFPDLRTLVAAHPAAFPALLDWLAGQGDPSVATAVATRRAMEANQARMAAPPVAPMVAPPAMTPPVAAGMPVGGTMPAGVYPSQMAGAPAPFAYGQPPVARARGVSGKMIGIAVGVLVVVVGLVIGGIALFGHGSGPNLTVSQFQSMAAQEFQGQSGQVVSGQDLVDQAVNNEAGICEVTRQDVSVVLAGIGTNGNILFLVQPGTAWSSLMPKLESCMSEAFGTQVQNPTITTTSGVKTWLYSNVGGGSLVLATYGNVGLLEQADADSVNAWLNGANGGPARFRDMVDQAAKG